MLPFVDRPNNPSDAQVFSDLKPDEIDELREWFCYIKPIGPGVRIMADPPSAGFAFCVVTAGTEMGPVEEIVCRPPAT